jgi:hypothetical protein
MAGTAETPNSVLVDGVGPGGSAGGDGCIEPALSAAAAVPPMSPSPQSVAAHADIPSSGGSKRKGKPRRTMRVEEGAAGLGNKAKSSTRKFFFVT